MAKPRGYWVKPKQTNVQNISQEDGRGLGTDLNWGGSVSTVVITAWVGLFCSVF